MAKASKSVNPKTPKRTEILSAGYNKGQYMPMLEMLDMILRKDVKFELQRKAEYNDETQSFQVKIDFIPVVKTRGELDEMLTEGFNTGLQQFKKEGFAVGNISDGYHTFDELYEHRIVNFIALCSLMGRLAAAGKVDRVWRSHAHSDSTIWNGWFILGIYKEPGKQITYHLPISKWEECEFAETLDKAPEFDGHTSADVLERIKQL